MKLDTQQTPKWRQMLSEMDSPVEKVRLPKPTDGTRVSQDAEWCEVDLDGETRRIRFHDYDEIYKVPGLYEAIFYESLKCCSPTKVTALLEELLNDFRDDPKDLKVLDLGAGNGMVGEELRSRDAEVVVGVDIIPEAKEATQRDRPGVYDDYFVTDFTDLPEKHEEKIRGKALNCLTSVSALGFGDIPPQAFIKALDLIETPGWAAFTIKEDFLREDDSSGFARLIRHLCSEEILQMQAYRRFRHRISMTGEPLYYVAMIAKKLRTVPASLLAAQSN